MNEHENDRSVQEIARYLQTAIPAETWKQEKELQNEEAAELAADVKEIWDKPRSIEMKKFGFEAFFTRQIKMDLLASTVQELTDFLNASFTELDGQNERRMVGISHRVADTELTHEFDVNELNRRIEHIFQSFYENDNQEGYYAPYLCFVQSSGMGKTKIIYELCKYYKSTQQGISGRLVLCREASTDDVEREREKNVFDHFISLKNDEYRKQTFEKIANDVFGKLDRLLHDDTLSKRVVLFFDEAHYLLGKGNYSGGQLEAMLFRLVRLWICEMRAEHKIVAVFTGTTAKLTNFIIKNDLDENMLTDTRDYRNKPSYYKLTGRNTYKPFYTTTTIGCLRFQGRDGIRNDYQGAIAFGRPLFASMTDDELKKGEKTILGRLLQDVSKWEESKLAWLGALGTRVQMGQTTLLLASKLVGKSYANMVGFTPEKLEEEEKEGVDRLDDDADEESQHRGAIKICFPPDPVCARLSMCLMDSKWSMDISKSGSTVKGKDKAWWVRKMKELFSGNLCSPEKGDFGEVMVALYFLFCADTLREQLSKDYTTFSVPLDKWIVRLGNGGRTTTEEDENCKRRKVTEETERAGDTVVIEFSAIQVCRNYIRAYDDSWTWLRDEVFLKNIYTSGTGFYVFPGCGIIDLVFALRLGKTNFKYVPMFVSVKSHVYFGPGAAKKECERMKSKAEDMNFEGLGALCILVVFGSSASSNDGKYALSWSSCKAVASGSVVSQVLRIPTNDVFGLSEAYLDLTTMQDEMSEVLASHSFLGAHSEATMKNTSSGDDFTGKVLRTSAKKGQDDSGVAAKTKLLFNELAKFSSSSDQMDTS